MIIKLSFLNTVIASSREQIYTHDDASHYSKYSSLMQQLHTLRLCDLFTPKAFEQIVVTVSDTQSYHFATCTSENLQVVQ